MEILEITNILHLSLSKEEKEKLDCTEVTLEIKKWFFEDKDMWVYGDERFILKRTTEKAILLESEMGNIWIPKSVINNQYAGISTDKIEYI
jgi:hypothetical protein